MPGCQDPELIGRARRIAEAQVDLMRGARARRDIISAAMAACEARLVRTRCAIAAQPRHPRVRRGAPEVVGQSIIIPSKGQSGRLLWKRTDLEFTNEINASAFRTGTERAVERRFERRQWIRSHVFGRPAGLDRRHVAVARRRHPDRGWLQPPAQ
jgi:hypothetical protein